MGPSLIDEIRATLGSMFGEDHELIRDAHESISAHPLLWWLKDDWPLFQQMATAPQHVRTFAMNGISRAIGQAALHGPPKLVDIDTVRFGVTIFGDPKFIY